jgi:Zn-finger nucleic acid-binding protein
MAGLREHHGEIVGKACWEPILDESTWRSLSRLLTDPERRGVGGRTRQGVRILSGLTRCGKCDSKMWLSSARGVIAYRCRECSGVRIKAEPLDQLVETAVLAALDGAGMEKVLSRQSKNGELAIAREVEAAQTTLVELATDWGSGALSRAEYLAAKQGAEHRRIAAQRRLDGISSTPVLTGISGPIRESWAEADIPRRRAIVAAVVDSVVVSPVSNRGSTTFDRGRIHIAWKA